MKLFPVGVLLFALIAVLGPEAALANKFTTIGGGVSGASNEKLGILKEIASWTGLFFIFLGTLALLTRNRFEGHIGMTRKGEKPSNGPYGLIVVGVLLALLFLV